MLLVVARRWDLGGGRCVGCTGELLLILLLLLGMHCRQRSLITTLFHKFLLMNDPKKITALNVERVLGISAHPHWNYTDLRVHFSVELMYCVALPGMCLLNTFDLA